MLKRGLKSMFTNYEMEKQSATPVDTEERRDKKRQHNRRGGSTTCRPIFRQACGMSPVPLRLQQSIPRKERGG